MKSFVKLVILLVLMLSSVNISSASTSDGAFMGGIAGGYSAGYSSAQQDAKEKAEIDRNADTSELANLNQENSFISNMCLKGFSTLNERRKCVQIGIFYWKTTNDPKITRGEIQKLIDVKIKAEKDKKDQEKFDMWFALIIGIICLVALKKTF